MKGDPVVDAELAIDLQARHGQALACVFCDGYHMELIDIR